MQWYPGVDGPAGAGCRQRHSGPDTVQIGVGTYSNPGGFVYDSSALDNAVTIVGAGQGSTTLQMPGDPNAYEQVLSIDDASSVNDLSIMIPGTPGANTHQDIGLDLFGGRANHVSVSAGSSANNDTGVFVGDGSSFVDGAVSLPYGNDNTGVMSNGNAGLVRSTVKADFALSHSSDGEVTLLNRVSLKPGPNGYGAVTDAGPISISNSLIDLGSATNAVGLRVANYNGSVSPKSIHANHVTIVGGGTGSRGLQVLAASPVANGAQLATATLANSTIRGPAVPIDREAQNTSDEPRSEQGERHDLLLELQQGRCDRLQWPERHWGDRRLPLRPGQPDVRRPRRLHPKAWIDPRRRGQSQVPGRRCRSRRQSQGR